MPTSRPLLSIPCKELGHGPKHLRATLPAAWLAHQLTLEAPEDALAISASRDGDADLRITPSGGNNYLAQGHVRALVDATCGRCLGPATVPVDTELTILLVPRPDAEGRAPKGKRSGESEGEFEFDPDEADVATYDGETIVLDDLVREAILLELPISPLCSEDCPGMRTAPAAPGAKGTPPKIDPRLAPLASLAERYRAEARSVSDAPGEPPSPITSSPASSPAPGPAPNPATTSPKRPKE